MRQAHSYSSRGLSKKDASLMAALLHRIRDDKGQLDTTELAAEIVRRSKPATSPTHGLFEWDDRKAAVLQRLDRARDIVRRLQIRFDAQPEIPVRAFPVVVTGGVKGPAPMEEIRESGALMDALVEQARADARIWLRRWEHLRDLAELRGVFEALADAAVEKKLRKRA